MILTPRILPEANIWTLVRTFFRAYEDFQPIYEGYEDGVLGHAHRLGVDRRYLQLSAAEVSKLLDFNSLEQLRDGPLYQLKAITHALFRDPAKGWRDKLDRYANELFHNVSILKEHQLMVATFANEYDQATERLEYDSLLAEVHEEFPTLINRLHALFSKAKDRIEALLPSYRDDSIFIRSLYLYGELVFANIAAYPNGPEDIERLLYPRGGNVEAALAVARSFHAQGFFDHAQAAVHKGFRAHERLGARLQGESGEQHSELLQLLLDVEDAIEHPLDPGAPRPAARPSRGLRLT